MLVSAMPVNAPAPSGSATLSLPPASRLIDQAGDQRADPTTGAAASSPTALSTGIAAAEHRRIVPHDVRPALAVDAGGPSSTEIATALRGGGVAGVAVEVGEPVDQALTAAGVASVVLKVTTRLAVLPPAVPMSTGACRAPSASYWTVLPLSRMALVRSKAGLRQARR